MDSIEDGERISILKLELLDWLATVEGLEETRTVLATRIIDAVLASKMLIRNIDQLMQLNPREATDARMAADLVARTGNALFVLMKQSIAELEPIWESELHAKLAGSAPPSPR